MTGNPDYDVVDAFKEAARQNISFMYEGLGDALSDEPKAITYHPDLLSASLVTGVEKHAAGNDDPETLIAQMTHLVEKAPEVQAAGLPPLCLLSYGPSETGKHALWQYIAQSDPQQVMHIQEGSFIELLIRPNSVISGMMEDSLDRNNIYYWSGAEILEEPLLAHYETTKEFIRSQVGMVLSHLPGTHVVSMHTRHHYEPARLGKGKLPWFLDLFHMRLRHRYMNEAEYKAAWEAHMPGPPKKFETFPEGISAGSLLRTATKWRKTQYPAAPPTHHRYSPENYGAGDPAFPQWPADHPEGRNDQYRCGYIRPPPGPPPPPQTNHNAETGPAGPLHPSGAYAFSSMALGITEQADPIGCEGQEACHRFPHACYTLIRQAINQIAIDIINTCLTQQMHGVCAQLKRLMPVDRIHHLVIKILHAEADPVHTRAGIGSDPPRIDFSGVQFDCDFRMLQHVKMTAQRLHNPCKIVR